MFSGQLELENQEITTLAKGMADFARRVNAAGASASLIESEISERVALMCASNVFAGIAASECAQIAMSARARVFSRHEVDFVEGQPIRQVLLIKSGYVKLTQLGQDGSEVILRLSGAGDIVGVLALSAESHHTCSAHVVETCTGLLWDVLKFETFLERLPDMRKNVARILADRLNELEQRFREVATEKVCARVAHELTRLLKQVGKPLSVGIEVGLSREELAQMTGTTLFTISRLMSAWEQLGFVLPRREAVVVRDPQRLLDVGDDE
ncbi:MAG: hypothetical protein DMG61_14780 [Acidobacteria bacterium]|nr:MAG: hypothetical protein DMG61_14780 [Acidobacteriota bacterium]